MNPTPIQKARFGWCLYDWANSAFATVIVASVLPVYFAALVPAGGAHPFGIERPLSASALWGYAISLSLLLVAVAAPWLGALADRRGLRRRLLVLFTLGGAAATSLLALTGPGDYLLVAALFMVANIGFAGGNIFYNAFLPALASGRELDRLSSRGYALGYVGGGLMLLIAFVLIQAPRLLGLPDQAAATRVTFLLTGLWWAFFALPAFVFVREENLQRRPAPMIEGIRGYLGLFAQIRRYPDLLRFLIAFLFYNDGIQTMIAVSAIFGREELGLSQTTILGTFLMIQFVAMPGSLLYGRAAERWGAKRSLTAGLLLFVAITAYAFTIRHGWQFWALGFAVALLFGGVQAISRSLYASLIPAGRSAEFFSFFAISGKFASIFGPLVFAVIADLTGSSRLSILALSAFFLIGLVLLAGVDPQRGRAAIAEESP